MSAALFWVLRAYLLVYSVIGVFIVALIATGLLGRLRSALAGRWDHVPSRYSDASTSWSSPDWAPRARRPRRQQGAPRLRPVPVRTPR